MGPTNSWATCPHAGLAHLMAKIGVDAVCHPWCRSSVLFKDQLQVDDEHSVPEPVWGDLLERLRNMKKCNALKPVRQFIMVGRQKGPPTKAEEAAGRERVDNLRGAAGVEFQKQCEAEMRRAAALVTGAQRRTAGISIDEYGGAYGCKICGRTGCRAEVCSMAKGAFTNQDVKDSVEHAGARSRRQLQIGVPPTGFLPKRNVAVAMERAREHRPDEDTPNAPAVSPDDCVHALAVDFLASDEGRNHSMDEVVNFDEAQAMGTDNKDPAGLGDSSTVSASRACFPSAMVSLHGSSVR